MLETRGGVGGNAFLAEMSKSKYELLNYHELKHNVYLSRSVHKITILRI